MSSEIDAAWTFFQNVAGQIILIGGAIVGAVKWLESRQNTKIEDTVDRIVTPIKTQICADLLSLKNSLETQEKVNRLQLRYIQKAIDHLQKQENNEDEV